MSDLEHDLLRAVPADARRVLVVGNDLLAYRPVWEARNPLAAIEKVPGPWTRPVPAEKGVKAQAAILSLDELGDDAALAVGRMANCLAPGGTLALFAATPGRAASLPALSAVLTENGLTAEREFGGDAAGYGIWRFHLAQEPVPQIRVKARVIDDRSGSLGVAAANVRMLHPFEQLNSFPGIACEGWSDDHRALPEPEADAGNIFLLQRIYFLKPELYVPSFARNRIVIIEIDDLPTATEQLTPDVLRRNLSAYHAIQTSTPSLADHLRQFNPEVGVFGNHLARVRPHTPRPRNNEIRIVFAAINRELGWRDYVQAYREVVSAYGDRVLTVVVGDRKFHDALTSLKRTFHPTLPYAGYRKVLDSSDIALLPLADTQFDRSKTDLKFIECAEAGVAVLASHIVYGETVKPGKTGFVYRNVDEFRRHLRTLIEETTTREKVARHANRYVREQRMLAHHVRDRYDWYRSLVDRREELERLRQDRAGSV